jgi:hypothetical protein
MHSIHQRTTITAASIIMLGLALTGCSSTAATTSEASSAGETAAAEAPAPAPVPDLTGEWKQSNSKSADSYQAATITGTTIEINWVSDGGATKALYWAGSYVAPTAGGAFSWESTNDTTQTENALLASSDPTKTFSYDNGIISYEVSALGVTTTVELKQE